MNATSASKKSSSFSPSRRTVLLAGTVIVLAGLAAYHGGFSGGFIFDDKPAIPDNLSIRHLWPVWPVFSPPPDTTVSGRPVLNFSLAINYALSGERVWSYHAMNLLIHLLAGLTLFGVVRRTLLQPRLREKFGAAALPLALAVAVLWTVHPLQTESVTYIVQRAESLMGLFYLLTLYAFIRGVESRPGWWFSLAIAACLLGMATKEVMVSVPLIALLYDRTFVAGTFRSAWQKRRRVYAGLAATWILLGVLVASTGGDRSGSFGIGKGCGWWSYGLTQFGAITRYLWLSVWPHPLVVDYGTYWITGAWAVVPPALVVVPLVAGTVLALWRRPVWGFLGMFFFSILAPTSLVPGTVQMTVEHRMYLPLAAVLAVLVTGLYRLGGRRSLWVCAAVAAGFALLTARRNEDYHHSLSIWRDTVAQRPENARIRCALGYALQPGQNVAALTQFEAALRLKPDAEDHARLGNALLLVGRVREAISQCATAVRLEPDSAKARNDLGNALAHAGRYPEAFAQYRRALRLMPDHAIAHNNFAIALRDTGRVDEAIFQYRQAIQYDPGYADAHNNLGMALANLPNRLPEAVAEYRTALRLRPDFPEAHNNLGNALNTMEQLPDAVAEYHAALRLNPDYADAHFDLGCALFKLGQNAQAVAEFQTVLRLEPDCAPAHFNWGMTLAQTGRIAEAIGQYEEGLRLAPNDADARATLAQLQALPH